VLIALLPHGNVFGVHAYPHLLSQPSNDAREVLHRRGHRKMPTWAIWGPFCGPQWVTPSKSLS
jgi:hypothetical protein